MRALVISAFALTLFLSAVTVYVALSSSEMDGEPYALIAIEPPAIAFTASVAKPLKSTTTQPAANTAATEPKTIAVARTTEASETAPLPVITFAKTPKLTPTPSNENSNNGVPEEALGQTEEQTPVAEAKITNRRTTEVARPVSTTPGVVDDPFFSSAEPGLGLGVGNLGPLEPEAAN